MEREPLEGDALEEGIREGGARETQKAQESREGPDLDLNVWGAKKGYG